MEVHWICDLFLLELVSGIANKTFVSMLYHSAANMQVFLILNSVIVFNNAKP